LPHLLIPLLHHFICPVGSSTQIWLHRLIERRTWHNVQHRHIKQETNRVSASKVWLISVSKNAPFLYSE